MLKFLFCICVIGSLAFVNSQNFGPNVAFHKPVIGNGVCPKCLTDGIVKDNTYNEKDGHDPFFYVDLGETYNLTRIRVYGQNQASFGKRGLNAPFTVATLSEYVPPCEMNKHRPGNVLAYSAVFKGMGQYTDFLPTKPVRYILLVRNWPNKKKKIAGLALAEVMAFGKPTGLGRTPAEPRDGTPVPDYYVETRKQIIRKQQTLIIGPTHGELVPLNNMRDVPLDWHENRVSAMAVKRDAGKIIVIQGTEFIPKLLQSKAYQELRTGASSWLTNNKGPGRMVDVQKQFKSGDILLITRESCFNMKQLYDLLTKGYNSAIIGYGMKAGKCDHVTQLMKYLLIGYRETAKEYPARTDQLQPKIMDKSRTPLLQKLYRAAQSWTAFHTEEIPDIYTRGQWTSNEVQYGIGVLKKLYGPFVNGVAVCKPSDKRTAIALKNYHTLVKNERVNRPYGGMQQWYKQ